MSEAIEVVTSFIEAINSQDVSGGKVLRTKTKKTSNRANTALRIAAQSLYEATVLWAPSSEGCEQNTVCQRLSLPRLTS